MHAPFMLLYCHSTDVLDVDRGQRSHFILILCVFSRKSLEHLDPNDFVLCVELNDCVIGMETERIYYKHHICT